MPAVTRSQRADLDRVLVWLDSARGDLGIDPACIGVHGVSAGGGLAAALALLARDRGGPSLCFQALAVPSSTTGWRRPA